MSEGSPHIQVLKDAGYRLTQARLTVLGILEAERGHITSAEVLERVAALKPAIGRASVFRTLDLLTQLGIIRPTYNGSSLTPTYVLMRDGHHHHAICTGCQRFFEFDDCGLEALSRSLEQTLNLQISGHLLEFYGICAACRPPAAGASA